MSSLSYMRETGAPEWFLELKGGKSKQTFCPIINTNCVGIRCKCCETRSHTWIKSPPNGDGNYHSGEHYYCSKLDLAIPDEDAIGLKPWVPDYPLCTDGLDEEKVAEESRREEKVAEESRRRWRRHLNDG